VDHGTGCGFFLLFSPLHASGGYNIPYRTAGIAPYYLCSAGNSHYLGTRTRWIERRVL